MERNTGKDYGVSYIAEGPTTAIGVLEQFSTTAEGIAKFSHLVITEVEEGRVSPLKVALLMKTLEVIKDQINETLAPYYMEAARKCGGLFEFDGAKMEIDKTEDEYDYSACCHRGWNDLTKIINLATQQRKDIEVLLKVLTEPTDLVIERELIRVQPPANNCKEAIKITIK